jgi:hypothetical protein
MNFFELIKKCAEQPESSIKSPKTFSNAKDEVKNTVNEAVAFVWDYTDWAFKYKDDTQDLKLSDLPVIDNSGIRVSEMVNYDDSLVLPDNPAMRRAYISSIIWKANIIALSDPTSEENTSYNAYLAESLGLMNKYNYGTPEIPPRFVIG